MVNLKYISSNGIEFDLHDFDSAKLFKAAFHDVEWIPETVSRQYGVTVNRFTKEPQVFDCTFRFKGDVAQRKSQIDSFIFETENDLAKLTPGYIWWNNQYIAVYFNKHNCYPVDSGMNWTELKGQFYAPFPFWIEEFHQHISPGEYPEEWLPEDVRGYPKKRGMVYEYTYSYPYGVNSGVSYIDTPLGADFNVIVYGPVDYVRINIAGNNYEVDYPLLRGEKLIVDSRDYLQIDQKCYVVKQNGDEVNVFDYRDPTSELFKRLPGGEIVVYVAQPYTLDLTLFLERSGPI